MKSPKDLTRHGTRRVVEVIKEKELVRLNRVPKLRIERAACIACFGNCQVAMNSLASCLQDLRLFVPSHGWAREAQCKWRKIHMTQNEYLPV